MPHERLGARFDAEEVIRFADPDGMTLELLADDSAAAAPVVSSWPGSPVPAEHALRGFHSVSAVLAGYERTARLLTETLGFRLAAEQGNRFRYVLGDDDATAATTTPGRVLDLLCAPDGRHARPGAGSVHHIAFRVPDDAAQFTWRETLVGLGYDVSPVMDRDYFHSIYFREPGGVLFEIATDPPGFTADEPLAKLGHGLKLPRWLEPRRAQIEEALPLLTLPAVSSENGGAK